MKGIKARIRSGLLLGSRVPTCDNSGAKMLKIFTVFNKKGVKRRVVTVGVGDLVMASVIKGRPDMRKQVVHAVIVRQRKEYRRPDGMRIKFEDNAAVVLKDDKGNPKGTIYKGPIAKEVSLRWPSVAKVASIIV